MMIEDATHYLRHHKIKTEQDLYAWAKRQIEKLRKAGYVELVIHEAHGARIARVDRGRWTADCDCGAGLPLHPDWSSTVCAACGATYLEISFPSERELIERELSLRPRVQNRFWFPHETVADLMAENIEHGVRKL